MNALQQTFEQVTLALHAMYSDQTSADARRQAQQFLLEVQQDPAAWSLGWMCLQQPNHLELQYFGAQTVHIKVSRDFATLPEESYDAIREELFEGLFRACAPGTPPAVMRRLCFALVAFALHAAPAHWPDMVASTLERFQAQHAQLDPSSPLQPALLLGLLEFLRVLPEEFTSATLTSQHRGPIQQVLTDSIPSVLALLSDLMGHPAPSVTVAALATLGSWVQFGIPIASLGPLLDKAVALVRQPETFEGALNVLIEVVSHRSNARFEDTICRGLLPLVVELAPPTHAAIGNEDEDHVETVARFVAALVESFPTWFVKHLDQPAVLHVAMPLLVHMVAFPGFPGADQEISEIPLQSFFLLQETLSCPDQISFTPSATSPKSGAGGAGDVAMSTNSSTDSLVMPDLAPGDSGGPYAGLPPSILDAANTVFTALLEQLVARLAWPTDAEWASWTKDRRSKWAEFRRNCTDNVLVCYYVLRSRAVDWLVPQLATVCAAGDPRRLEALLFAVRSLSEALNATDPADPVTSNLLGAVFTPAILAPPVPHHLRVRQTLLYVVGEYATWFHAHPHHVGFAVSILLAGLREVTTVRSASKLLREFCDICRANLAAHLGDIMAAYLDMKAILPPPEKQKVAEAISMVIQKLPQADMIPPLGVMLEETLGELNKCLDAPPSVEVREHLLLQLTMLQAFCKGLQASDMEAQVIDLTDDEPGDAPQAPATAGADAEHPMFAELRAHLVRIIERVHAQYAGDLETLAAVTSLMSVCVTSVTRPMVFPVDAWVPTLAAMVHSGALFLYPATLEVFGDVVNAARPVIPAPLAPVLGATVTTVLAALTAGDEGAARARDNPDLVDSFVSLLRVFLRASPAALYASGLLPPVLEFVVQCLTLKERMSLKAASHFLCEYITHAVAAEYSAQIGEINVAVFPRLLATLMRSLLNDAPRSIVPNFAEILFRAISLAPNLCRECLTVLLVTGDPQRGELVPSLHPLTRDERTKLVRYLMGTRQIKRFKDHVREAHAKATGIEGSRF
ncbi:hypothetical protein H9P43_000946 [Blastocladiella emersonii ATCC 22665]|nr:hypothetical protein H9P43_000946 [Blastocladiella emersonii ATCC 22665]